MYATGTCLIAAVWHVFIDVIKVEFILLTSLFTFYKKLFLENTTSPSSKPNMDPYEQVSRGKLKLKGDGGVKKKKKNKKKEVMQQVVKEVAEEVKEEKKAGSNRTKAEMAYQKMQEKMVGLQYSIILHLVKIKANLAQVLFRQAD